MQIATRKRSRTLEQRLVQTACANKYEIDASFRNSFRDYTNKLMQFKIVGEDKLKERGYAGVDEFAARCVDDSYLTKAKR